MSTDQNTGRVAVITGASSGIGEATARALAADGHRVAPLGRRIDRIDRIQAVAEQLGNGATAIEADDLVLITAPAPGIGVGNPPRLAIAPIRRLGFHGCGGPAGEKVHRLL